MYQKSSSGAFSPACSLAHTKANCATLAFLHRQFNRVFGDRLAQRERRFSFKVAVCSALSNFESLWSEV